MTELIGKIIKEIRWMTDAEIEKVGWDRPATAIVLNDDTVIFPSRDDEGNGNGTLFGTRGDTDFYIFPEE